MPGCLLRCCSSREFTCVLRRCFQVVVAIIISFILEAFVFRIQNKKHTQDASSKSQRCLQPIWRRLLLHTLCYNLHGGAEIHAAGSLYTTIHLPVALSSADWFLVHCQVTIIFVVSVCLFVCFCRVFLSRLWSDFDQTRTCYMSGSSCVP